MPSTPTARAWRPVIAVVLLVVMAGTAGTNAGARPTMGLALLLAGVAALAVLVPVRRAAVPPILNGAAVGAYLALGLRPGPVFLTVALTTLVVALDRRPRAWVPWTVAGLVLVGAGAVAGVLRGSATPTVAGWQWVAMAALAAGAGAVAGAVRTRDEARVHRAERVASEERLRMAQDLHDGVGHGLAVVAMQAGVALHVLDRDPAAARASLEAIRDTSRESLDLLRDELARLSGTDGAEAVRRPEAGLGELAATLDRVRSGGPAVELDLRVDGVAVARPEDLGVSEDVGAVVHRVVQEALTNVLRHAAARRVRVRLAVVGDALELAVDDDGRGVPADPGAPEPGATEPGAGAPGLGLRGMRGRVEALGGDLEAGPGPDGGFRVVARLPLDARVGRAAP